MGVFEIFRRIRGCSVVGRSMSLGVGFEVSKAHVSPMLSFSLFSDQDVALSYVSSTIFTCCCTFCHKASCEMFSFIRVALVMMFLHSNGIETKAVGD